MSHPLASKTVVVTGGARGIGASFVRALVETGARVVVFDLVRAEDSGARFVEVDVSDPEAVASAVAAVGPIDVLVNNAAVYAELRLTPFWEIEPEAWDRVFAVNVRGPFLLSRAVAASMPAGGSIVNITSGTVYKGTPGLMHYVASKGALVAMTHCMARELGPRRIRVNAISPGLVLTEGVRDNDSLMSSLAEASIGGRALGRAEYPDDLAGALLFLCSPAAAFITGHVLVVDGGSVMR